VRGAGVRVEDAYYIRSESDQSHPFNDERSGMIGPVGLKWACFVPLYLTFFFFFFILLHNYEVTITIIIFDALIYFFIQYSTCKISCRSFKKFQTHLIF
jgi:hypothetical protein